MIFIKENRIDLSENDKKNRKLSGVLPYTVKAYSVHSTYQAKVTQSILPGCSSVHPTSNGEGPSSLFNKKNFSVIGLLFPYIVTITHSQFHHPQSQ